ncbi:MAG: helix-turn-helix transcriptional regulator [Planctomycetes bacterium]|nr:helix-turn-helix transcriptional regulator [Planctomycetota bacterium]
MEQVKTISAWMTERGMSLAELVAAAAIEERVVTAIANGRYTPSPQQRERLCAALGITPEQVAWGHVVPVEHLYGHGPQFGRTP